MNALNTTTIADNDALANEVSYNQKKYLHHFRTLTNQQYKDNPKHGKKRPSLEFTYDVPSLGIPVTQAMIDVLDIAMPKLMLEMLQHKDNLLDWDFIPPNDYAAIAEWFNRERVSASRIYTKVNIETCKPLFASVFTLAGQSQAWIDTVLALSLDKFIALAAHATKARNVMDYLQSNDGFLAALTDDSITRNENYDLMLGLIDSFVKELDKICNPAADSLDLDNLI